MDGNTAQAERWLATVEKLLAARDLHGTRTFAIRARESAPILADQILAVTDTLLTAQSNPHDWYGILQIVPFTQSMEVVASQYRKLALLLNPMNNPLSYADQAFRFVSDAWNVLSNPSKKAMYDNDLRFVQFGQVPQLSQQHQQTQFQQTQPQTQMLFMQQPAPPPPRETQTLFMQAPQNETQATQSLFWRSPRNNRDGNAAFEGGGQLGLNYNPPEPTRSATESAWTRQINHGGLAGPSQINQTGSGSVGSSKISRPEPIRSSQMNQTGIAGISQFNRTEPTRTGQINQSAPTPSPMEHSRTEPTGTGQTNQSAPTPSPREHSRTEPTRTGQINQSTHTPSSMEHSQTEPTRTGQINQSAPTPLSMEHGRIEPTRTGEINQSAPTPSSMEHGRTEPTRVSGSASSTLHSQPTESEGPTFWTACPYCYVLYEYPKAYEDCTLRCQTKNCRRAFHAVVIPSPPVNGGDTHFCCWGFYPLGFSGRGGTGGNFTSCSPVSTMFSCPSDKNAGQKKSAKNSAPRVFYDDVYVEISDSSGTSENDDDDDDDWEDERRDNKKAKNAKGKGHTTRSSAKKVQSERAKKGSNDQVSVCESENANGVSMVPEGVPTFESIRRGGVNSGRKQMRRGAKELGKLDLNVEFSNEVEEPVPGRSEENHARNEDEDNIEGNAFFEGLDEFLSSLPILSVVGDDKVKVAE